MSAKKQTQSRLKISSTIDPERLQQLKAAFHVFDMNHDGVITRSELKEALIRLGEIKTKREIKRMFEDADINHDNRIDFDEFLTISTAELEDL